MTLRERTRTAARPPARADAHASRRADGDASLRVALALGAGLLATTFALLAWVVPARAEAPYAVPDQSWISLTGTVAGTAAEEFTLDYGEGLITVEMDDWAWYTGDVPVVIGDRVTVYGQIDDDLFEGREVVAESIYIEDRATYYYPTDVDLYADPMAVYTFPVTVRPDGSWVAVSGTVEKVDGREFILDTGTGKIQIDTIGMTYNPLDDVGYQQIDRGDRVSVSGRLDLDFFERKEIQADAIVSLSRDESKKSQKSEEQGS